MRGDNKRREEARAAETKAQERRDKSRKEERGGYKARQENTRGDEKVRWGKKRQEEMGQEDKIR